MHRDYRIRRATPRDTPSLPAIELAAGRLFLGYADALGLTPEFLEATNSVEDFVSAETAQRLWVVTTLEDVPVGFALTFDLDGALHLDEIDIHPSHGRRGLGSALLTRVCVDAASMGYRGVTLSTFRDVPWNAPFYARHGFSVLKGEDLTPGLHDLREHERALGLRIDLRVMMRYECR